MSAPAVVPVPVSIDAGDGAPLRLTSATSLGGDPEAVEVFADLVTGRTGLDLPRADPEAVDAAAIVLRLDAQPDAPAESYTLSVTADGASVTGADPAGLFYGVHSLAQLLARDGDAWYLPAVRIVDAPRYAYRGVMLDVARRFHPVSTVRAYIDRAAALKFNVLHLHLTDDQGWRLQLRSHPELAEHGSGSGVGGGPGGSYSREDYHQIVSYAASRHMTVVPEIDMPGHTHAVGLAHPHLVEDPVITDAVRETVRTFGGGMPATGVPYDGMAVGFSSLRLREQQTYDFVADVFGELAAMTPGPYLHLGGDEALGTAPEDYAEFIRRVTSLIADLGKIPVAWHEAGAAAGVHPDTVGQYWGFVTPTDGADDAARTFVRNDAGLILSPADAAYLDMKPHPAFPLGLTWANGATSVERAYAWDPAAVIDGVSDVDILGVEAPLWGETVADLDDIDALAFPRIAAVAEAAWSPPATASTLRTWASFRERVGALGPLWTSRGIRFDRSEEIPWTSE